MPVISIRKAKREGARLVIGLAGISGSGKTRTALELAFGMANFDASKIGFLDTENKRGSLYADCLKNDKGEVQEFFIGDLEPPFSPERYAEAIRQFAEFGVEVLVIDSTSHEYEGIGGVLEMREPLPGKKGKRDNYAKAEHKKFMNTMLQCNMHVICCTRAREKVIVQQDGGKTVYIPQGIQPICEKNFMFEMTASVMMYDGGKQRQVLKSGDGLENIFGTAGEWMEGYLTAQHGKQIRDWVDGARQLDPKVEEWRNRLRNVTEKGEAYTLECWGKTPAKYQKALGEEFKQSLLESARAYDKQAIDTSEDAQNVDDLNSQVMGQQQEG